MKEEKSKNPGRIRYLYNNVCFDFSHQREDFTVSEAQNRLWISDRGRHSTSHSPVPLDLAGIGFRPSPQIHPAIDP